MSLIRVRRERKDEMGGPSSRPPRLWKQLLALIIVLVILYYLSRIA